MGERDRGYLTTRYSNALLIQILQTMLDSIQPEKISGLRFEPHEWQKKGAAQGDYLCEHPDFKLFCCGDEMGVGKTLLAVLMVKLAQPKRGFCVVVAPKPVCGQWENEFDRAFTEVRCDRSETLDSTC
jgi:SNF2 family DNA or RNA helicase